MPNGYNCALNHPMDNVGVLLTCHKCANDMLHL